MKYPIKSDSRYSIALEFTGHASGKPRHVLRFAGERIDDFNSYSAAVVRAVGHKSTRDGATVFTEITTNHKPQTTNNHIMKKLPFTRDGFTLFIDNDTGKITWEKTDNRPTSEFADLLRPENPSRAVLEDDYSSDPRKACQRALRLTRDVAESSRLEAINVLLGMHGTEVIRGDWQNGYWCDIVAAYVNTGDPYATTVLHVRGDSSFRSSRFIVSSWGDFVERFSEKYGIE